MVGNLLVPSYENRSEAIHPTVCSFHNPSSSALPGIAKKTGDSARAMGWRNARFVSVADLRFDRKIQCFERLCPVVKAPFAPLATSSTGGGAALTSG